MVRAVLKKNLDFSLNRSIVPPRARAPWMKGEPELPFGEERQAWRVKALLGSLQVADYPMQNPKAVSIRVKKERLKALRALTTAVNSRAVRKACLDYGIVALLVSQFQRLASFIE